MRIDDETIKGVERLREIFENRGILKLGEPDDLRTNGFSLYFAVTAFGKLWDFCVTREQLSDLPAMPGYLKSADALARSLEYRFKNVSPNLFLTASGEPMQIEIEWPLRSLVPIQAATCVGGLVHNWRTQEFVHAFVVITHQQSVFNLKEDPFQLHEGIANSVRSAIDSNQLQFYPTEKDHPIEMQRVPLILGARTPIALSMCEFLKRKVGLMGFRSGDKDTQVWIADPWDADYLGVKVADLQQEAEILEAEGYLKLEETRQLAHAENNLLKELRSPGPLATPSRRTLQQSTHQTRFDVFLSHASEDKDFVRDLAAALRQRGVTYWLDEIQLRLGDSLREMIDKGLASSRYGVVVLSSYFFAKKWPQRELDGLLSMEIDRKVILPVWHEITVEEVSRFSPSLAGRYAAKASEGVDAVADKILQAITP
jgi:TIR domain